jgi:hypothetical protein
MQIKLLFLLILVAHPAFTKEKTAHQIKLSLKSHLKQYRNAITRVMQKDIQQTSYGVVTKKNAIFIKQVLQKLNLHNKIQIKNHNLNCHGMMHGNVLSINEYFFNQLTNEEKIFLIAHEAIHFLLDHNYYKTCHDWIDHASDFNGFARALEKEADIQAAKRLKCAAGGIKFFKRLQSMWGCSYWNKKDKNRRNCRYDPEYPTLTERIAYLTPIAAKQ